MNHNLPLDRPYTLRNPMPFLLEREYHRLLEGSGPRSYIFPRPCTSALDSSQVCQSGARWTLGSGVEGRRLSLSPVMGYEYRWTHEHAQAAELGLVATGASGPLSAYLDTRMFSEFHQDARHASYDREFVERQDENASGGIEYSSYSRFRSNLSVDFGWGRLTAARDAAHWGPGLLTNLVFHQDAVPFNQLTFTTHLGPLSIQTLYGQLAADTNWALDTSADFRSVYAHRYELRTGRNLVLGVSEQLVVHKWEAPFAFLPVVPLYVAKAGEKERLNNGNISGDFSFRWPGLGAVYSEFLIDDIQAPTSLFDDQWGNKWAWMAGAHIIGVVAGRPAGIVAEYCRVEPWVYTHYLPRTAQAAHLDHPLGNQRGPDSRTVTAKGYVRSPGWYASLAVEASWKGTGPGSSVLDIHPSNEVGKTFLAGAGGPDLAAVPFLALESGILSLQARIRLGADPALQAGARVRY